MGVTRNKCTGCKACIAACPYGARYVHPDGYVDKCTFCLHRVRAGSATRRASRPARRARSRSATSPIPESPVARLARAPALQGAPARSQGNEPNVFFLS